MPVGVFGEEAQRSPFPRSKGLVLSISLGGTGAGGTATARGPGGLGLARVWGGVCFGRSYTGSNGR